jgi:hypothetical protein
MRTQHVLVTGAHRSGTTGVGRTLAHHPSLVYVHEPFNVSTPNPAFGHRVRLVRRLATVCVIGVIP